MTTDIVYTYRGKRSVQCDGETELNRDSKDGLSWVSKCFIVADSVCLHWQFEWNSAEQERNGLKGFDGEVIVEYEQRDFRKKQRVMLAVLNESGDCVSEVIGTKEEFDDWRYLNYKLILSPTPIEEFEERFGPSEFTDMVLLVEGRKMHINKMLLAAHSQFFRVLFSSDFKERSLNEIPILDVKYEEFARFLSILLPKPYRLPFKWAEPLLILADRFIAPKVTEYVELRLLGDCKVRPVKLLSIAEKYNLELLREGVLSQFTTRDGLRSLKLSPESEQLSLETKNILYYRLLKFM